MDHNVHDSRARMQIKRYGPIPARIIREMSVADRESFCAVYNAYALGVHTTALAILKNEDAAHDVVHDVFLRAWQQAGQYDSSRGTLGVWLRAVARNLSIDRLRSARRLRSHDGARHDGSTPADESLSHLVTHEQLETLRRGLHKLRPMHRRLIEMAYDRELSHSDIAKRLNQPLGTVKSRIRQALGLLRTFAAEMDPGRESGPQSWLAPASEAFTTFDPAVTREACVPQIPNLKVLVVDDDEETVRLVSAVLRRFKVHAETRTSAKAGLKALEDSWPDVLISDLNMPEEDGYSLIGKARAIAAERGQRLRSAAFTSWGSEHERSRALLAGFDAYLHKPVHPLALISAVATLTR